MRLTHIAFIATIFASTAMLAGCSIFANTTPQQRAGFFRNAPVIDAKGNEKMQSSESVVFNDSWTDGSFEYTIEEEYQDNDGLEVLKSRKSTFRRNTDTTNAAAVAMYRAEAAGNVVLTTAQFAELLGVRIADSYDRQRELRSVETLRREDRRENLESQRIALDAELAAERAREAEFERARREAAERVLAGSRPEPTE
jgi:hypothetical protein